LWWPRRRARTPSTGREAVVDLSQVVERQSDRFTGTLRWLARPGLVGGEE